MFFYEILKSKSRIKVNNLNPQDLETETGGDAVLKFKEIEKLKVEDFKQYNIFSQQFNFALKKPISPSQIEISQIEIISKNGADINYRLKNYVG